MVEKLVFQLTLFIPVLDTNYTYISEMYIYHRYMTQSFRALAVSNSKCHSDIYRYVGNVNDCTLLSLSHNIILLHYSHLQIHSS